MSNGVKINIDREYLSKAKDFRNFLKTLPQEEFLERSQAAAKEAAQKSMEKHAKEESLRFFNRNSAMTDVNHWSRMSVWTIDEATALSLGRDPRIVQWDHIIPLTSVSAFARRFANRRNIMLRAKQAGQLWEPTIPSVFLAWTQRMKIEFPEDLGNAIAEMGTQVADWKTLYDTQKKLYEDAQVKFADKIKELTKETESNARAYRDKSDRVESLINEYEERIKKLKMENQKLSVAPRTSATESGGVV